MKKFSKIASLCLCLLVIALFSSACSGGNPFKNAKVGDYVKMGNYPQTKNGEIEPIEWLVLSKEEDKMLVISRYGLEAKPFESKRVDDSNDWSSSEIRQWLNNNFYNQAFNEKEKKNINYFFEGDNVFLLSKEEAEIYFPNDDLRRCNPTDYAVKNGAYVTDNGYSAWWLRSPYPPFSGYVYYVINFGGIGNNYYCNVDCWGNVVRPALWINL